MKDARPRKDLRGVLQTISPDEIFGRYSRYSNPDKGSYYLIPLLKELNNHVVSQSLYTINEHTTDTSPVHL